MRQLPANGGYFIPIATMANKVYSYNPAAGSVTFLPAVWASTGGAYVSYVAAGAGVLRDMGKSVVSASRTFRKVQLVVPQSTGNTTSTFGVGGATGTTPVQDFLTGYIEVGFDAAQGTAPTPVAKWGR
jgi:hypothetical protein